MTVAFHPGAEPIPGYRLLDRLGSGGFGEVWRCEAPGGIGKAVKVIFGDLRQRDNDSYRFAEQELKSLKRVKQVRHPYLLALDRFDIVDGRLMIVMELADCNLWDRFRVCREAGRVGIPRDELLGYMSEAAEVLDLMNDSYQLQHLDIKPQNLFLLYNHVKVADFGQVKDLEKHVAQVTGGITPVYAAPETFDGFVSRYCDQYSLACVYQELLSGVRPFDGTSMNQLLMQHISAAPNLNPSPPADRPALARALSKKPEDRFQTVGDLVEALKKGTAVKVAVPVLAYAGGGSESPFAGNGSGDHPPTPSVFASDLDLVPAPVSTPLPRGVTVVTADRPAPPERTGPGSLRPAVVIGVGYAGRRALQRFRRVLAHEGGSPRRLPHVRTLYIDTDPDAAAAAAAAMLDPALHPLPADDTFAAPLHRAAHYLRPRNNGRALIEGWFDPALLYKLPRIPVTAGVRPLGRLALCDHFRTLGQRVQAEIEAATTPAHLDLADTATRRGVRTNRPRVYILAGLGGGTGGGMLIDMAYLVRHQLKRLGYDRPDVVGVLMVPPPGGNVSAQARANTYAALTELNHFGHPDTAFVGGVDEFGLVRDADPPFTRTVLLPGFDHPPETPSGSQTQFPPRRRGDSSSTLNLREVNRALAADRPDPTLAAADYLRLDLFTTVGRVADTARADLPPTVSQGVSAVGASRLTWPRAAVVERASRVIAPVLLGQWLTADPAHLNRTAPGWAGERWAALGLAADTLRERLRVASAIAFGEPVESLLARAVDPITPKGWMGKLPDPRQVAAAVEQVVAAVGRPREAANRPVGRATTAAAADGERVIADTREQVVALLPALLDAPGFRLAGAEEVARRLFQTLDGEQVAVTKLVGPAEERAAAAFDRLLHYVSPHKGVKKPSAGELAEALKDYPGGWFEAVLNKQVLAVYAGVRELLVTRLDELATCRRRLTEYHDRIAGQSDAPLPPADPTDLLPPGCTSTEHAAQKFLSALDDDDLGELEQRFQRRLSDTMGGVFEGCVNSADGPEVMLRILRDTARDYLSERLGEVDLAGMLKHKFGPPSAVAEALDRAITEATPEAVGRGPWAYPEVCVFGTPTGAGGEPVARQATPLLPPDAVPAATPDEVAVYREWPNVPLAALDQLGPAWEAAYRAAPDATGPVHTRTDITGWRTVDG